MVSHLECVPRSLIKPDLRRLSGSGLQLREAIVERDIEQPRADYRRASVDRPRGRLPKHILVLPSGTPSELEWNMGGGRKRAVFSAGDAILNPAGLDTAPRWSHDTELVLFAVGTAVVDRVAEQIAQSTRVELVPRFHFQDELLRHLALALAREFEQDVPPDIVYAESLMHTLIAHLIRSYSVEGMKPPTTRGGLSPRTLKRVTDYINAHLDDTLALEGIADTAGYSPSHFIALFKRSTGRTPHQYVITRRIERAVELLRKTEEPIAAVALQAGFADQSHLTRVMRRRLGVTPGVLRSG